MLFTLQTYAQDLKGFKEFIYSNMQETFWVSDMSELGFRLNVTNGENDSLKNIDTRLEKHLHEYFKNITKLKKMILTETNLETHYLQTLAYDVFTDQERFSVSIFPDSDKDENIKSYLVMISKRMKFPNE